MSYRFACIMPSGAVCGNRQEVHPQSNITNTCGGGNALTAAAPSPIKRSIDTRASLTAMHLPLGRVGASSSNSSAGVIVIVRHRRAYYLFSNNRIWRHVHLPSLGRDANLLRLGRDVNWPRLEHSDDCIAAMVLQLKWPTNRCEAVVAQRLQYASHERIKSKRNIKHVTVRDCSLQSHPSRTLFVLALCPIGSYTIWIQLHIIPY